MPGLSASNIVFAIAAVMVVAGLVGLVPSVMEFVRGRRALAGELSAADAERRRLEAFVSPVVAEADEQPSTVRRGPLAAVARLIRRAPLATASRLRRQPEPASAGETLSPLDAVLTGRPETGAGARTSDPYTAQPVLNSAGAAPLGAGVPAPDSSVAPPPALRSVSLTPSPDLEAIETEDIPPVSELDGAAAAEGGFKTEAEQPAAAEDDLLALFKEKKVVTVMSAALTDALPQVTMAELLAEARAMRDLFASSGSVRDVA
jgi:hypothetical protein